MSFLFDQEEEKVHSMLMTQTPHHPTLRESLEQFIRELDKSPLTIAAYRTDVQQFLAYLTETDFTVTQASQVDRTHITEYLSSLKGSGRSGIVSQKSRHTE